MVASRFMALALAEAELARGRTAPNPPVGAVLARGGEVIGRGHTQPPGSPHAEIMALREAGDRARGATLYVTLEPCCHHGRTPPCTDALLAAGVSDVRIALIDPYPLVAGQGIAQMRQHDVAVEVGDGAEEALPTLAPFFKHVRTGLPFVTAKWAMSLDGRIATSSGESRWISGPEARAWAHRFRDAVDAVLVGVGTAVADDPSLTVRLTPEAQLVNRAPRPNGPARVVLDSTCRLSLTSRLLAPGLATGTLILTTSRATPEARSAIQSTGACVEVLPDDEHGRVALAAALADLGQRGLLHVLVEGGARVHAAMLRAGQVDDIAAIVAPKIIGGDRAPGPVGGAGISRLADAVQLEDVRLSRLGDDVLIEARPMPRLAVGDGAAATGGD